MTDLATAPPEAQHPTSDAPIDPASVGDLAPSIQATDSRGVVPTLDVASRAHLNALASQLLVNAGLPDSGSAHSIWLETIVAESCRVVQEHLGSSLAALWATRRALAESTSNEAADRDETARAKMAELTGDADALLTRTALHLSLEPTTDGRSPRRIIFKPDVYKGDSLYGTAEQTAASSHWRAIGGTFVASGAPAKELARIGRILPLLIFATTHLLLETGLLEDLGCARPIQVPFPVETDTIHRPSVDFAPDTAAPKHGVPLAEYSTWSPGTPRRSRSSSTASWTLFRTNSGKRRSPQQPSKPAAAPKSNMQRLLGGLRRGLGRKTVQERDEVDTSETEEVKEDPLRMRRASSANAAVVDKPLPPAPDLHEPSPLPFEHSDATMHLSVPGTASAQDVDDRDPYEAVIARMEKAIISLSPSSHIPPPYLLVRLRTRELAAEAVSMNTPALSTTSSSGDGLGLSPPDVHRPSIARQRSFLAADEAIMKSTFADQADASDIALPPSSAASTASRLTTKTRLKVDDRAGLATLTTGNASIEGVIRHQSIQALVERQCEATGCLVRQQTVLPFYRDPTEAVDLALGPPTGYDMRLGAFLARLRTEDAICDAANCGKPLSEHTFSWLHCTTRVQLSIRKALVKPIEAPSDALVSWTSCSKCSATTRPHMASAATCLYSFGKLLEILVYDNGDLIPTVEALCEHVDDPSIALIRNFSLGNTIFALESSSIEASLYELRLPRSVDIGNESDAQDQHNRRDAVALDELLQRCAEQRRLADLFSIKDFHTSLDSRLDFVGATIEAREDSTKRSTDQLNAVRKHLRDQETSLLVDLADSDRGQLNAGRASFVERGQAAMRRIIAWETKHLTKDEAVKLGPASIIKPDYFGKEAHVLPAGNDIVLRENEPSSLIAFALSSVDYRSELVAPHDVAAPTGKFARPDTLSRRSSATVSEVSVAPSSLGTAPQAQQTVASAASLEPPASTAAWRPGSMILPARNRGAVDPDDLNADFSKPVPYTSTACSKAEPRPSRSISVLKTLSKKRSQDLFGLFASGQRVVSEPMSSSRSIDGMPSAPLAAVSESNLRASASNDQALLDSLLSSRTDSDWKPGQQHSTPPQKLPKLIADLQSRRHVSDASTGSSRLIATTRGDLELLSDDRTPRSSTITSVSAVSDATIVDHVDTLTMAPDTPNLSVAGSVRSVIASPLTALWSLGSLRLSSDANQLALEDSLPHVSLSFAKGGREFSITVWHAAKFALLRKLCGLTEEAFIESLSRCSTWSPSGGKSKCEFFVSRDGRFVLKQMREAWSGSEKDSLLDLARSYFGYLIEDDAHHPSLMAKIFGVYTLQSTDEAGNKVKRDVIVLEQLFAGHAISKTYDLKGISSRKAPVDADGKPPPTLYDADFALAAPSLLLRPHSHRVVIEAISNDTKWLADAQVVDYSALLGVAEQDRVLVVGLIDILSSYGLAKALEGKAKAQLAGKDKSKVTIQSPHDYAARFRRTIAGLLDCVPEKWTQQANGASFDLCPPL